MRKKRFWMGWVLACLLILTGCQAPQATAGAPQRYSAEFLNFFDTMTQIIAYTDDEKGFREQAEAIRADLERYHQWYDIYNDYPGVTNIKTINDNAGRQPVKVAPEIIRLLSYAKEAYRLTNGRMNVAFGAVLSIWHDYRTVGIDDPEMATLPPMEFLREAAKHTDINQVVIDEAAGTVYLADPDMSLDVGAIAKGYAAEQVARLAVGRGFTSGLISVGGNVKAIGMKADGTGEPKLWNIGIENPDAPVDSEHPYLTVLYLTDRSLVTSGDYVRYYTVGGKKYHHIINPDTLMPANDFRSVTIVCPDSGEADALSTGVFNMSYKEGRALIDRLPEAEAYWVFPDGRAEYTDGMKSMIKP